MTSNALSKSILTLPPETIRNDGYIAIIVSGFRVHSSRLQVPTFSSSASARSIS